MRMLVRIVGACPSSGSCCVKSVNSGAFCHAASERSPSIAGPAATRTARNVGRSGQFAPETVAQTRIERPPNRTRFNIDPATLLMRRISASDGSVTGCDSASAMTWAYAIDMTVGTLMTADELLRLPDDGWRYELVRGELQKMSPTGGRHGEVSMEIYLSLGAYVKQHRLGR